MFTINEGTLADYVAVRDLKYELYRTMAGVVPTIHSVPAAGSSFFSEDMFNKDLSSKLQAYFIAIHDHTKKKIGFLSVGKRSSPTNPLFTQNAFANIDEIYVVPQYRQCGIARSLVKAAFKWAEEHGLQNVKTGVYVMNREGFEFWQKIGFQPYKALVEYHL